ncbi:MAG: GxxExxY protein [Lacipirellulaceae bacterium]
MEINQITGAVLDTSIEIHRRLGPGLLETVYRKILAHELRKQGFQVEEEVPIPVEWDGVRVELGFRADIIVNAAVVVETKSIESILPVHKKQVLTHLKIMNLQVGLLINFGETLLKTGTHRIVNNFVED